MSTSSDALRCNRRAGDGCDPERIVGLLSDPDARALYFELDEPATVEELATACDLPSSTAYRKVASLEKAGLIAPLGRRTAGSATQYEKAVEHLSIQYDDSIRIECVAAGIPLYCEP